MLQVDATAPEAAMPQGGAFASANQAAFKIAEMFGMCNEAMYQWLVYHLNEYQATFEKKFDIYSVASNQWEVTQKDINNWKYKKEGGAAVNIDNYPFKGYSWYQNLDEASKNYLACTLTDLL